MRQIWFLQFVLIITMSWAATAQAEVLEVGDSHFSISHTVATPASVEKTWDAMTVNIAGWWHPDHSWSGDASNFYFNPGVGGCFCERLPAAEGAEAGSVEHLRIIYYKPSSEVRFDGALGPLMDLPVQGRMLWQVKPAAEGAVGSEITFTYRVHGYMAGGFAGLAPVVDSVIGQQVQRLQALLQ